MLITDFYNISTFSFENHQINAMIHLNASHEVFKGHFPNNPVTPGVCMLQILKELTEKATETKLYIKECSNVKFMALINPEVHSELKIVIDLNPVDNGFKLKAVAQFETTTALKVNALLTTTL